MPTTKAGLARLIERAGIRDQRLVAAFRAVDRADFVPDQLIDQAYLDRPLGIPHRQVTTQPSLVARMVEAAAVTSDDRVLEIGTGYGFQTALLARLGRAVVSVERHSSLAEAARHNLERTGVTNASIVVADGWKGRPDRAPFDSIIVSAAAEEVPPMLADQLREGGRLVIPIREEADDVYLFVKRRGRLERTRLVSPASFVPLVPGRPT
ncbi:MAG: protein-L-isoaspartate(D-aspartate) O-methyltransferase [Actinomycetota bacterium]